RAEANAAQATLQADEAAVEGARLNLAYCEIRSPITGRTGSVLVKAGNVVKVSDTILVLIDQLRPIYVSFSVPERALPQIRGRRRWQSSAGSKDFTLSWSSRTARWNRGR